MFDDDGFLLDLNQWSRGVAIIIADKESISLSPAHWELIELARCYQSEFDLSPEMRPFIKYIKRHLAAEKASSLYCLKLFPNSPAKLISKIAGLPKPPNCI